MSSLAIRFDGVPAIIHEKFDQFRDHLELAPFWFSLPPSRAVRQALVNHFGNRIVIHAHGDAAAICVHSLMACDLPVLSEACLYVFINNPRAFGDDFSSGDIAKALLQEDFRLFCSYAQESILLEQLGKVTAIGKMAFLLTPQQRLALFPSSANARVIANNRVTSRMHAIFVFDLIQDIEILGPLVLRAAAPDSPFRLEVAVSTRILKSHAWPHLNELLTSNDIVWYSPQISIELVSRIGSGKTLLVTAAESSAPGHAFCHQACRIAPANTIKVTMQHGYECVGFRHHRAHELQFPSGIRFASDVILTWQHPDELPDLHPLERSKCVGVGVIKSFAEQAVDVQEADWARANTRAPLFQDGKTSLLIAENLHSVRFVSAPRYHRFLSFIREANLSPYVDVTIRSHPGKRTLEKEMSVNGFKFLQGSLTAQAVCKFDVLVSPPSTIVLDAAMAGVPVTVWTDAGLLGDASNYSPLRHAADFNEWLSSGKFGAGLAGMKWAVDNTASMNGVPAAWAVIANLA